MKSQIASPQELLGRDRSPVAVAAVLDRLAFEANDMATRAAFQRAARAIFQQSAGRPPSFAERDRKDLVEVVALIAENKVKNFNAGARLVAQKYGGDRRKIRSVVERLRRKREREKKSSTE